METPPRATDHAAPPPVRRFLALLLLTVAATLGRPDAYVVKSISGGTWESTGAGGYAADANPTSHAGSFSHGVGTGGGFKGSKGAWVFNAGHGTCKQELELTATLEWSGPAGTEPPSVIVQETATASWSGNSGACDSGLGGTTTPVTNGASQTGVRHTVKTNPAHTFTVKCTPSANASYTTNIANYVSGGASVSYNIVVYNLLKLSGGKDSAGKDFLVGQRCVGSLNLPSGWAASGHSWSVSGADPFKSFIYNNASNVGYGHRINLAPGDKDDETLSNCFAKAGEVNVSVTVNLTPPGSNTIIVSSQAKAVVKLPSAPMPTVNKGKALLLNDAGGLATIGVYNADGTVISSLGIQWSAAVTTPTGYGGVGRWGWVQTLNESTTRILNNVTQVFEWGTAVTGWFTEGSDGPFPSSWLPDSAVDSEGFFAADSNPGGNFDTPRENLESAPSSYHVERHFSDWLMYCPPGMGSQFVPLHKFTWYLKGNASHTAPTGTWIGSGIEHDTTAPEASPAFPDWSNQVTNGSSRWRNQ